MVGDLAELLVESGLVPQAHIDNVMGRPGSSPARMLDELSALALEHEEALAEIVAEREQLPCVIFSTSTIDITVLGATLPEVTDADPPVLPIAIDGDVVTVAISHADQQSAPILEQLGVALGRRVVVVAAVEAALRHAVDAAVAAHFGGATIWKGERSQSDDVDVHLARPPVRARLPWADSVARALSAMMSADAIPQALSAPASLGTLKLKQVRAPRPATEATPTALAAPQAPTPPPLVARDAYVLVVEDDEAIGRLICKGLEADGVNTHLVGSGDLVADALRARRPDGIVLDAMLPGVHGFEICAALKQSPEWCAVPIIMISAVYRGFQQAREIQETHGADAFIEKPFQLEHVRRVVGDLLQRPVVQPAVTQLEALSEARARALVDHSMTVGDLDAAGAMIDTWIAAHPLSARAWLERGHHAIATDDAFAALRAYERAAVYDRHLFVAQLSLAMLYEQLGFARRARSTWNAAAACAPDADSVTRIRQAMLKEHA